MSCDCEAKQGCIPGDRTHASKEKQRWLSGPAVPRAGSPILGELTHSLQGKGKAAVNICVASGHRTVGESKPLRQDIKVTIKAQTGQHMDRAQSQLVLQSCRGTT